MLAQQRVVLGLDLLLELLDLTRHHLEPPLHLGDLVLRLDQVLRVQVAVGAHRLVQALLLLHLRVAVGDPFLELDDAEFAHLHLVERVGVLRRRLGGLGAILLALDLELEDRLPLLVRFGLVPRDLDLEILPRVLVHLHRVEHLRRRAARLDELLVLHVAVAEHGLHPLLLLGARRPRRRQALLLRLDGRPQRVALLLLLRLPLQLRLNLSVVRLRRPHYLRPVGFEAVQLVEPQLQLGLALAPLGDELAPAEREVVELALRLQRLLNRGVVVLARLVRPPLLLSEPNLELAGELDVARVLRLLLADLVLPRVERRLQALELLLRPLLLRLLLLRLLALGVDRLAQRGEPLLLRGGVVVHPREARHHVGGLDLEQVDLLRLRVALLRELLLHLHQLVHRILLADGQPGALLDQP